MNQPSVPWWLATGVVVLGSVDAAALAYQDPSLVIPPAIRFGMFLVNVGLITLAAVLNIKKPTA